MGCPSIIYFIEEKDGKRYKVVSIYNRYDGDMAEIGFELAKFIKNIKLVYTDDWLGNTIESGTASSFGCLAAQFISQQKKGWSSFILITESYRDDDIDWEYWIIFDVETGKIKFETEWMNSGIVKYKDVDEFYKYCEPASD